MGQQDCLATFNAHGSKHSLIDIQIWCTKYNIQVLEDNCRWKTGQQNHNKHPLYKLYMIVLSCPVQMPLQILQKQVTTIAYHKAICSLETIHNREKLILQHCKYPMVKRDAMPVSYIPSFMEVHFPFKKTRN